MSADKKDPGGRADALRFHVPHAEDIVDRAGPVSKRTRARLVPDIAALILDLDDARGFAPYGVGRCRNCHRMALARGHICAACGHDPSDDGVSR
jgi:hypothetical protein